MPLGGAVPPCGHLCPKSVCGVAWHGTLMARAPKVTWDRVRELIQSGAGTGFDEAYRPILEIKRWNPSPASVQVVERIPPFRRRCHFFSISEYYIALLLAWAGAWIREQYPLWPWAHMHPEYSRNPEEDATLPRSPGMLKICRDAGIEHGKYIGTRIDYIWSIDLCATLPWVQHAKQRTLLVSIKPLESERYLYPDPLDRGVEKLEAERRYARQLGVGYILGDRSLYPGPFLPNLDAYRRAAVIPHAHPLSSAKRQLLERRLDDIQVQPITESIRRAEQDLHLSNTDATYLIHHCLWSQEIDCDLAQPMIPSKPPRPGGRHLRQALRSYLESEATKP